MTIMHGVDVWIGSLQRDNVSLSKFAEFLSREERQHLSAIRSLNMQCRYIAVRGLLRVTLAHYLAVNPADLQFIRNLYGKPALSSNLLYFNLSHSADCLAIAVSRLENIGIDIERIKPRNGMPGLAMRCFSAAEYEFWSDLPAERQLTMFYQLWNRKEAFVKAVGRGIAVGLAQCEVLMPDGQEFLSIPAEFGMASDWRIAAFSPAEHFSGALVAPSTLLAVTMKTMEW